MSLDFCLAFTGSLHGNEKQTRQKQKKAVGAKAPPPFSLPSSERASSCLVEHCDNHKFLLNFSSTTIDFGGPNKDRTCDLLNANQALSQLSYGPPYLRGNTISTQRVVSGQ